MKMIVLDNLIKEDSIQRILTEGKTLHWKSQITPSCTYQDEALGTVCRISLLLSNAALVSPLEDNDYAEEAYTLLSSFPIEKKASQQIFETIVGYGFEDTSILFYFYLASLALKTNRTISARLILQQYDSSLSFDETDWGKRTLYMVFKSLLLLIRKQNGFSDIREALRIIDQLREEQKDFEETYISKQPLNVQRLTAIELVGVYHVSKALYETADYLINGHSQQQRRISSTIRQHIDIALHLVNRESRLHDFFTIIWNDLQQLVKNSIWSHAGFHDQIKRLCQLKAEQNGLLELLPSQQEALGKSMLNVAANAIVLQMPTSSGKTLMAEFNILVTRSLRQDAKVVYVVPSRALMNQVYFDLKNDLRQLDLAIERTSSAVEVDPTENNFLMSDDIDILVSTPEKLDLLIRRRHPSVEDVSLFIVDEAHTIENGQRGARLELLMTMLRRERPDAKFMLLSSFLPDGGDVMKEWLGGGNAIQIDWRPSEKLVFGLKLSKKTAYYTILPTSFSSVIEQEQQYDVNLHTSYSSGKKGILEYANDTFGTIGRTQLILCTGRKTANKQAKQIADRIGETSLMSEDVRLVCKYMNEEIGCSTLYTELLSKGVTIHHAGLSDESKILIEHLIRNGDIRFVCATSTIAEGVNFPVSSVYFDTFSRGKDNQGRPKLLSTNDFWNIAGRAGRTMVDDFGKIILPFNSTENIKKARSLISKSAESLTSVLAQLFVNREEVLSTLSEERPSRILSSKYPDSFGPLFQYFVHLLNVAENDYAADVEDLFKDTLVYNLLSERDKEEFIALCTRIYISIQNEYSQNKGALCFADKTGFSVPSVLQIMREKSSNQQVADLESWRPEVMFNIQNVDKLSEKIRVISTLRETRLGTDSDQAPLNTALISEILIKWVKGDKLNDLALLHPYYKREATDMRVANFVQHLTDMRFKASWGLSALEGIVRGNKNEMKDSYIPSYVYYGVADPKSLALRMIGIPRSLSTSLSQVLDGDMSEYSFSRLRNILGNLTNRDWDDLRPRESNLTGMEWKRVVEILMK